ncbi:MAG: nucleotidyltransferase [Ignavibacteria bacterium]|nr:nucleotidyltransferase [Ignavibacteria bacterium]
MLSLNDIKAILDANKQILFGKYSLKSLAIFGSYSRNEYNEKSDIDILAEFIAPVGIELIDLGDELESLLQQKIDIVTKNGIKQRYFKYIEKDLIYV